MKKKRTAREEPTSLKEKLADNLRLPKDLLLGVPLVTITGQTEAYIENYRGILEYTEKKIKLQTKTCCIEIDGRNLNIGYYTNDEMKITGHIVNISYR